MEEIQDLVALFGIPVVNEKRNYWLVRTKGGKHFEEFYFEKYIAIGWNKVNDLGLIQLGSEKLKEAIEQEYPKEKRAGYAANQIIRFVSDMKKGDIILIPNKDSEYVSFGEILEDSIYTEEIENSIELEEFLLSLDEDTDFDEDELLENKCPFVKRRKVKWLKTIKRTKLDPYLYRLLHSHNTISNANSYAHFIDRSLNNFYIKGSNAHVIFEVTEKNKIPAVELLNFIHNNLMVVDEFNNSTGASLNKNNIDIKINVQSPGPIELFGNPEIIILIAVVGILLVGGGIKFKKNLDAFEGEITTDGLMEKMIKFINAIHNNKMDRRTAEYQETVRRLSINMPTLENDQNTSDAISPIEQQMAIENINRDIDVSETNIEETIVDDEPNE